VSPRRMCVRLQRHGTRVGDTAKARSTASGERLLASAAGRLAQSIEYRATVIYGIASTGGECSNWGLTARSSNADVRCQEIGAVSLNSLQ
jgi:hypothetical protein